MLQRIHVYLASSGLASRREAESWIKSGFVHINGKPARLGQKIDPSKDAIKVRGKLLRRLSAPKSTVVYAIYKPRGYVSTAKDPQGRLTVLSLVPKSPRVFPVGRLDINSEGLMLLTNDGDLALKLTHPRYEVGKLYEVKIRGDLDEKKIKFLKKGPTVANEKWKPAEVVSVRDATVEGITKSVVKIRVFEGKNHHVRRMFEAIKCRVIRLKRLEMGSVTLKGLERGGFRRLSSIELQKLNKFLLEENPSK